MLASAAQNFMKPDQSIEGLLSEILAHYLAVISFSRGAVYLVDGASHLKLSGQIGFPQASESALTEFFDSPELLREVMACEEPTMFSTPARRCALSSSLDPSRGQVRHYRASVF